MSEDLKQSSIIPYDFNETADILFEQIREEFDSVLYKYKKIIEEKSTESALIQLEDLNQALDSLQTSLEPICSRITKPEYLERDQEHLAQLNLELEKMMQEIIDLSENMKIFQEIADELVADAQG